MARVSSTSGKWLADGGCSLHMTRVKESFCSFESLPEPVIIWMANGDQIKATGKGKVRVRVHDGQSWSEALLHDVHYVPDLGCENLFSEGQAMDRFGYRIHKTTAHMYVNDGHKCMLMGDRDEGGLWVLRMETVTHHANIAAKQGIKVWHERLGHAGRKKLLRMLHNNTAEGMTMDGDEEFDCDGCAQGKLTRKPAPPVAPHHRCKQPGASLSVDLCSMPDESISGFLHFLLVKDEASCYRCIYFLRTKEAAEVLKWLKVHVTKTENQTGVRVKRLRSDNGREFDNELVRSFLEEKGIAYETTVSYSPYMNGLVERDNRTVQEMVRCMMHTAKLPPSLWAELALTAVYLMNRLPNRDEKMSPHELWHKEKPSVSHLRIIGSRVHVLIPRIKRSKLESVSWTGRLVGYGNSTKFYRVWRQEDNTVSVVKDVKIVEEHVSNSTAMLPFSESDEANKHGTEERAKQEEEREEQRVQQQQKERIRGSDPDFKGHAAATPLKMQLRSRKAVVNYRDYSSSDSDDGAQFNDAHEQLSSDTAHATHHDDDAGTSGTANIALLSSTDAGIPSSFADAMSSPDAKKWAEAMKEEMQSHAKHQTWTLVKLPVGRRAVGCRWVFAHKRDREGNITRYKARLVAKGFLQREGLDFLETFAPVIRYESLRLLLSVAAQQSLCLTQFDVSTAFLYGTLKEEIFMTQPEGHDDGSGRVCRLIKGLYGLRQSPRAWNENMHETLTTMGFQQLTADACVYKKSSSRHPILLSLFVDDGMLFTVTQKEAEDVISELQQQYKITLSPANKYIGLEIDRANSGEIVISQSQFVADLLSRFGLDDGQVSKVKTPAAGTLLSHSMSPSDDDEVIKTQMKDVPYREAVGSLLFTACVSRPDIAFATGRAAQFQTNPGPEHWKGVKRVMRYLRGTADMSIAYSKTDALTLEAYADSSGCEENGKSTAGVVIAVNGSPVHWFSRLQQSVSLSTTECEYQAMTEATKEISWIRLFLEEIGLVQQQPTMLFNDNQSAVSLSQSEDVNRRSKHIIRRLHYLREEQKQGTLQTQFKPTDEMPADVLTKPLSLAAHTRCLEQMNMKRKSERGLKWKALLMCLLILHDASLCHALWDPHPQILWRESKKPLVNGVELVRVDADILSPCHMYQQLTTANESHVQQLQEWCSQSFEREIMARLKNMDQQTHVRERRMPAVAAAGLAFLASIPGVGWVAAAVAVVVVAGVACYFSLSSRITDNHDLVMRLESDVAAMRANEKKLREFTEKAQKDIDALAVKHNLLSDSFISLKHDLASLITQTADFSSRFAVMGEMIEDSISRWKEGRVTDKLFRVLNLSLPCGARCPTSLMEPVTWERHGQRLSLLLAAPLLDLDSVLMTADPFDLLVTKGEQTCTLTYAGPVDVSLSLNSTLSCGVRHVDNVYHELMTSANEFACNTHTNTSLWRESNCTRTPVLNPQIKRAALTNVIYCKHMHISIDNQKDQPCPDYPFSLSAKLSFRINNYTFKGKETNLFVEQEFVLKQQTRINQQLMPGLNPFHVETKSGSVDLTWQETGSSGSDSVHWTLVCLLITALVAIALLLLLLLYKKSSKQTRDGHADSGPEDSTQHAQGQGVNVAVSFSDLLRAKSTTNLTG